MKSSICARQLLSLTSRLPSTNRALLQRFSAAKDSQDASDDGDRIIQLSGWLRSIRAHKQVTFLSMSDGTTSESVQAVLKGDLADTSGLRLGSSLRLTGRLKDSKGRGQKTEFDVDQLEVLGSSSESYPIQKKHVPADVLRDHAHLRFRASQVGAVMRIRDGLMREWHDYFESHDYTYVHTPIMTSSDCEGAGEAFRVTADTENKDPFFPSPAYLTVSSQLHLEAPTHALSRCYTLSPTFRAEPSATSRHLAEFYMLEAEVANTESLDQLMDTVENGIKASLRTLDGSLKSDRGRRMQADMAVVRDVLMADERERSVSSTPTLDRQQPFARITYTEAVSLLQQAHEKRPFQHTPTWGAGLQSEHEKYLAGEVFRGPVFVTNYPRALKPFYMRLNDDGVAKQERDTPEPTVACFDLLVPDVGELVGGSLREERLEHLERAIASAGLQREAYEWYIDLRRYGSVKHGGWGMGWERFICWITGTPNVKDVVAFPRWKGHCTY